jgi:hypothetical protein
VPVPSASAGVLQRKCECGQHTIAGGECDACSKKQLSLQRSTGTSALAVQDSGSGPSIVNEGLRSPGQPLNQQAQTPMEPRFREDFSRVHLHAAEMTENHSGPQAERPMREKIKLPGEEEELPKDRGKMVERKAESASHRESNATAIVDAAEPRSGSESRYARPVGVATYLRPGYHPQTLKNTTPFLIDPDTPKYSIVAAGGAPGVNNAAAASDCLPSTASAVLNWNVVSADAANWGVSVTSLALAGQVNVHPWPSSPNAMVVPNTPNPVDGGNINNTPGSGNQWQAAIADMANYHTPGGGAGPNWHSTAASSAHEWAHWNTDYVVDSVASPAGGNWPQANTDLDALRQPKASSPNIAAARAALLPRVNARLATWRARTVSRWNAIPDTAGVAGSTGYDAGKAVLDTHIGAVQAYANTKGWVAPAAPAGGAAPAATPATGLSRGAKVGIGIGGGALAGAVVGGLIGGGVGAAIGAGVGAVAGLIGGLLA